MRRVNLRFLLGTIVIVLVLAGGVHAVHTLQYGKHATTWKTLANDAKAKDNTAQQINYLRRYTALKKDEPQAFEDLGNALMDSHRYLEAQLPLATALNAYQANENTEDAQRVRRAQLKLLLGVGQLKNAKEMLVELIKPDLPAGTIDPEQAQYHEQFARCYMAEANWPEAARELREAIRLDPTLCDSHMLLAEVLATRLGEPREAVKQLQTMVAQNPAAAAAYRNRGAFRLQHRDDESVRSVEADYSENASTSGPAPAPLTQEEMLLLAREDSAQALQRSENDLANVKLSMSCAHALSELWQGEKAEVERKEAETLANRALAISEAKLQAKLETYRQNQKKPQSGESMAEDASKAKDATVPADVVRRYERECYVETAGASLVLAGLAARDGQFDLAIRTLENSLSRIGRDERLLLQLARFKIAYAQQTGGDADITRQLQMMRQRREAEPLARFLEAQVKMGEGEWAPALKDLEGITASLNDWPDIQIETQLGTAGCQMKLGQFQAAERTFREMLRNNPSFTPAQMGLAMILDRASESTASYDAYMQIVKQRGLDPADPSFPELFVGVVHAMIARIAAQPADARDWQEPVALIAETRAKATALGDGVPAAAREAMDVVEAELYFARKDAESAERILTAALEQNPQAVSAWIALTTIHDATQRWEGAESALRQAEAAIGTSDPTKVAQLKLTEAKHHLYRLSAALDVGNAETGDVTAKKVGAEVVSLYESIPPLAGISRVEQERYLQVKQQFAAICRSLGDIDAAMRIYQEVSDQDPHNLQTLVAQLELTLQRHKQTKDPVEVLDDIDPILEKIKEIEGAEGPVWNFGDATRLTLLATSPEHTDDTTKEQERRRKLLDSAEARLRTAERSFQRSPRIRRLRSFIFRLQGRLTDAVDLELELVNDPSASADPDFISELVQGLYSLRRFEEAAQVLSSASSDVASKLENLAPASVLVVAGEAVDPAQSRKLQDLAVQLSQAQADKAQDFRSKLAHGIILLRNSDPAGARAQFEAARDMAPEEAEPWIVLIELDVQEKKLDSARQTVERAAQAIREGDRAFALARAYSLLDDLEQSRTYLQQALAKIPSDLTQATSLQLEVLLRAAEAFAQQAQKVEAQAQRLADAQPDAASKQHQLAVEMDAAGFDLLVRFKNDGNAALAKLLSPPEKDAPPPTDSAALIKQLRNLLPIVHRRLALATFAKGGPQNRAEALRILDNNLDSGTLKPEDERLSAIILSQSPAHDDKLKALSKMQKLIRESKAPRDEDRLLAATLLMTEYRRQAAAAKQKPGANPADPPEVSNEAKLQLDGAIAMFRDIIVAYQSKIRPTADGAPTAPPATYVQALVGLVELLMYVGDLPQAELYVGQLTQTAPETQATLAAIATLHFRKGDVDAGVEVARRFAEGGPDEQRDARRYASSQLLESFGQRTKDKEIAQQYYAAAEQLLNELTADNSRGELLLAGFKARQGRAAEAVAAIEAVATNASDVQLASASAFAMRTAGNDEALLRRLQSALETALGANPDSLSLKLMLADLHTWVGDFDAGEQMYRAVIEQAPQHAAAANNLAFLLASRRRDLDESLQLINGAIKQQGQLAELLDTRAYVHMSRGNPDKALQDLDLAITEVSQPTYQYHKAQAQLALNRAKEAGLALAAAIEQGLSEASLHPLERREYQELAKKLAPK